MSCSTSFQVTLAECCESIVVSAGLLPNTDYAWLLTDIHGTEFYEYAQTDANGDFTIDLTSAIFTDGMFNRHSGVYTIEVFQYYPYYYNSGVPTTLTFCATDYDSILLDFTSKRTTQQTAIQYIKCV